jgi:hypothetical protein
VQTAASTNRLFWSLRLYIDVLTKEGFDVLLVCVTPLIIDSSDLRKKPDAHPFRHTYWYTRLPGQE